MKYMKAQEKSAIKKEERAEAAVRRAEEAAIASKREEMRRAEMEKAEAADKYVRLFAEFDNFKKRSAKEKDARYADAVIDTTKAMLDVLDNLQRALSTEVQSDEAKALYDGVALVEKQMKEVLSKRKLLITKISGSAPALANCFAVSYSQFVPGNTGITAFTFCCFIAGVG